jgi:hypothetical protein
VRHADQHGFGTITSQQIRGRRDARILIQIVAVFSLRLSRYTCFVQQVATFLAGCPAHVAYHGYYDVGSFDFAGIPHARAAFIATFGRV